MKENAPLAFLLPSLICLAWRGWSYETKVQNPKGVASSRRELPRSHARHLTQAQPTTQHNVQAIIKTAPRPCCLLLCRGQSRGVSFPAKSAPPFFSIIDPRAEPTKSEMHNLIPSLSLPPPALHRPSPQVPAGDHVDSRTRRS